MPLDCHHCEVPVEEQSLVGREPELTALAGLIGDARLGRAADRPPVLEVLPTHRLRPISESEPTQRGFLADLRSVGCC